MNQQEIVKNFRDLGESVNSLAGEQLIPEKAIYRGGRLNGVFSHYEILNIPTVLNLRSGPDDKLFNCNYLHVPAENRFENYNTANGRTKKWVNTVFKCFLREDTKLPIFIHCTSGKDRTGVICAVILKCFDIPDDIIIQEYLLSDGVDNSHPIKQALMGIDNIHNYLKGDCAARIKQKILKL